MSRRIMDIDNDKVGELFSKANDNFEEVYATDAKQDSEIKTKATQADFNTLKARVDNLTQTPAGSTEGNAELLDIRVGADGKTYGTAGEAVRAQVTESNNRVTGLVHNLIPTLECIRGYYESDGSGGVGANPVATASIPFNSYLVPVEEGSRVYTSPVSDHITMAYLDSDKKPIKVIYQSNACVEIPAGVAYLAMPIRHDRTNYAIISYDPIPSDCLASSMEDRSVYAGSMHNYADSRLLKYLKSRSLLDTHTVVTDQYTSIGWHWTGCDNPESDPDYGKWINDDLDTRRAIISLTVSNFISFAENDRYIWALWVSHNDIIVFDKTRQSFQELTDITIPSINWLNSAFEYSVAEDKFIIRSYDYTYLAEVDISDLVPSGATLSIGFAYIVNKANDAIQPNILVSDLDPHTSITKPYPAEDPVVAVPNHWKDKVWYAYGTSITNINNEGRYAKYLQKLSELKLVCKGISGGGICSNKNIKNAVMNTTDGKLEADLITLEVKANDGSCNWGTIYDDESADTFCGNLNACIKYLQENTDAQIVVMSSPVMIETSPNSGVYTPPETKNSSNGLTVFDKNRLIEAVCELNSVYYIPLGSSGNFGYYKQKSHPELTQDGVHPSDLGGYNLAQFIWSHLKNIPLWYTRIPTE